MFKGNKVWLCTSPEKQPGGEGDKVLIKYRLDQDNEYWVHKEAVMPIDPSRLARKADNEKKKRQPPACRQARCFPEEHECPPSRPCGNQILAYTDGASSGNPGPSGIGVVLRYRSHEKEISKYIGKTTNNVAELIAIKTALKAMRTIEIPVRIYTDSRYCYGLFSLGWKAKQNERLVSSIKDLMKKFKDIKILKVEGHAGIAENERADRLARTAIRGETAAIG